MRTRGQKLTIEQVTAIRADMRPSRAVAAEYGVSHAMIARIRSGRAWKVRDYVPVKLPAPRNGAKLTLAIAKQILADKRSARELARIYSVHPSAVDALRAGRTWKEAAR